MLDLKENEERTLSYWKEGDANQKTREKNSLGKKFYFLDGPPYASGSLASHHIWVYVIKDIMIRYKRYKGFNVHDRAGFDVHGLPIENKVERKLGILSKDDIKDKVGIANFVEACRSYAEGNVENAVRMATRFGISLDFENMYISYKSGYIDAAWKMFKKIYDKGMVYKDSEPIAYCPHCGTALSAQGPEVAYSDSTDPSIFVRFRILEGKGHGVKAEHPTYLVIWTTTPWTLPANMAIAANPDATYIKAYSDGVVYILAKERLGNFIDATGSNAIVKEEFPGSELAGIAYASPLEEEVPIQKKFAKYHRVIMDRKLVSVSEGTGMVHIAPGHGIEDYKVTRRAKIPVFSPVDRNARYTEEAGKYVGLLVPKEANESVMADLEKKGDLLFKGTVTHSYPNCDRCESKLIYKATEQWFIDMQKIKKKLVSENSKVKWHPEKAKGWQNDALRESPDWCISRQRFWGIPIPIWICSGCGEREVIGSLEELRERAGLGEAPKDPHRPHVDNIHIRCEKCGSESRRIEDIFDVWYDSGIAHTASLTESEFEGLFPADWITEGRDQIRGWFSTLLKTSVAVYGKTPFKEVTIGGIIFDELGNEMHRHLGNAVNADDLLTIVSADGYRLWCSGHPRWQDLKLKKSELNEADRNIVTLYNIAELVRELSSAAGYDTREARAPSRKSARKEDLWVLSRLGSLVSNVGKALDSYQTDAATADIKNFIIEDMSRFYLKFVKNRAATAGRAEMKRIAILTSYLLRTTLIVASTVMPLTCEYLYQDLFSSDRSSIFMNGWARTPRWFYNPGIEKEFDIVREISNGILNLRDKDNIKLRQPLRRAMIEAKDAGDIKALEEVKGLIGEYTNTMEIETRQDTQRGRTIRPLFAKLGPDFKKAAQAIAMELGRQDADSVEREIKMNGEYKLQTTAGTFRIRADHFEIVDAGGGEDALQTKYGSIRIDSSATEETRRELFVRETIRRIQVMRKEMGLTRADMIEVFINSDRELLEAIDSERKRIKEITKARRIRMVDHREGMKEFEIQDRHIGIGIERAAGG